MTDPLYLIWLDDFAAPAYLSLQKPFYGTMKDITNLIALLGKSERYHDMYEKLQNAAEEYSSGNREVCCDAANDHKPFLTPVHLLGMASVSLPQRQWEHKNIWGFPYELKCGRLEVERFWLQSNTGYLCAIRVHMEAPVLADTGRALTDGFWGFPQMLQFQNGWLSNTLLVTEREFQDWEECSRHMLENSSRVDLSAFCREIFGDG